MIYRQFILRKIDFERDLYTKSIYYVEAMPFLEVEIENRRGMVNLSKKNMEVVTCQVSLCYVFKFTGHIITRPRALRKIFVLFFFFFIWLQN